jgi:hypothetical protein
MESAGATVEWSGLHASASPRHPVRVAAVVGALASALWLVAYFLPWITFTEHDRERVAAAFSPRIEALSATSPEQAERYRLLLAQVKDHGSLAGLDLYHYARTAHPLNVELEGDPPPGETTARPWVVQRSWLALTVLLAVLPIASLALLLLLLARRLSHPGAAIKTGLVVVGCLGSALAIAWDRIAESHGWDVLRGPGIPLGLGAAIGQTCAGLFGVSSRNWLRVYGWSLLLLGSIATVAWAYVMRGWTP